MWQCCSSNGDAVVNKIEKEESNQDILVTTATTTKNDRFVDGSNTAAKRLSIPSLQRHEVDKFCKDFKELIKGYKIRLNSKFIDMSQPRDASYSKYDGCERLGEDVSISKNQNETNCNYNPSCFRSMPTEFRGITLRQLRAIIPLIKRRCKKEKWTRPVYKNGEETEEVERVTFESATLYDVNKYIIKPFTKYSQKSFVETMPSTKGTQPPHWFVR